jgi:hypothetical protein
MALADPNASFEVAVRHVFRHLREPAQLRRNPLSRRFFERGRSQRPSVLDDRHSCIWLMSAIETAAGECENVDLDQGLKEQAHRQRTIVKRTYFDHEPIPIIAADLGISVRQYYRERRAIVTRIGRRLEASRGMALTTGTMIIDELCVRIEQASGMFELGYGDAARSAYRALLNNTSPLAARVEILCRVANIEIALGADAAADNNLREARTLYATNQFEMNPDSRAFAQMFLDLVGARLAWYIGHPGRTMHLLGSSMSSVELVARGRNERAWELGADVFVERAERLCDLSKFSAAERDLVGAADILRRPNGEQSLRQRSDISRLWATIQGSRDNPLASLHRLDEAMRFAIASGSVSRIVLAHSLIANHHAHSGDDQKALEVGASTMQMARHIKLRRFRAKVALSVAGALLATRFWNRADEVLDCAGGILIRGSYDGKRYAHLLSEYRRRGGRATVADASPIAASTEIRTG